MTIGGTGFIKPRIQLVQKVKGIRVYIFVFLHSIRFLCFVIIFSFLFCCRLARTPNLVRQKTKPWSQQQPHTLNSTFSS